MDHKQANALALVPIPSDFGDLRLGPEKVDYELYEMAAQNLGILSSFPLKVGDALELELQGKAIRLIVHQHSGLHETTSTLHRFRLIAFDPEINFEKFFPERRIRSYLLNSKARMRYSRFPSTQTAPIVLAKTFGAAQVYKLRTVNASRSGLLLETCPGSEAPFSEGTLLELKIQRSSDEAISCLAKVVRCELSPSHKNRRYGIALTEIPNEQKDLFQTFMETLEKSANDSLRKRLAP